MWYAVIGGSGETALVLGDVTGTVSAGNAYEFWDMRPGGYLSSACIDTGNPTGAPAYDLTGVWRSDFPGLGDAGTVVDMGAYEALY
jgi:hypothetical protein